jgi:hypothetical protein
MNKMGHWKCLCVRWSITQRNWTIRSRLKSTNSEDCFIKFCSTNSLYDFSMPYATQMARMGIHLTLITKINLKVLFCLLCWNTASRLLCKCHQHCSSHFDWPSESHNLCWDTSNDDLKPMNESFPSICIENGLFEHDGIRMDAERLDTLLQRYSLSWSDTSEMHDLLVPRSCIALFDIKLGSLKRIRLGSVEHGKVTVKYC